MSQSRQSIRKSHSRRASETNKNYSEQNSYEYGCAKSTTQTFPMFIHEALTFMLDKMLELAEIIMNNKEITKNNQIANKPALLNLADKKKSNNFSPSTPPLANSQYKQRDRSSQKVLLLKDEFQKMKEKLSEFKNNSNIQISGIEDQVKNFEVEENQLSLIRIQQECRKQFKQVKCRLQTIEEDIGQLLLLYKQSLFIG